MQKQQRTVLSDFLQGDNGSKKTVGGLVSWLAAVLAFYVSQLSLGIINSVEAALFPRFIGSPLLYLLLLAAQVLFFTLCTGCYYAVLKLLAWTENSQTPYIGLLLFP